MRTIERANTQRSEDATALHHFPHVLRLQEVMDALVAVPGVTVGYYDPRADADDPWLWLEVVFPGRPRKVRVLKVFGTKTVNELEEMAQALASGEIAENVLKCPRCEVKRPKPYPPPGTEFCTDCYAQRRGLVEMLWCGDTAPIPRLP